jgi:secernin
VCDTLVVVSKGRVLFAKNSDRDPNEAQLLEWQPARRHPEGSEVSCTWIRIPQRERTHAVLLSRPFWMWGAEMGSNEHGVTIGNEAVFTRQPLRRLGLTGMDLLRLALERGTTAQQAVDVIVELLETHGQGGGCGHERRGFSYHNSFVVADPIRAFVLETAGRHHAVEEVEGVRAISNGLTIDGFAQRHGDRIFTAVSRSFRRRARTQELAEHAVGAGDLMALLRDHGGAQKQPRYHWLNGAMAAPCMHAGGLAAASQTTASWVAELTPGHPRHWVTATAAPCTGLFKPVRVAEPLDLGPAPTDRFEEGASLWWRHERLHRTMMRAPRDLATIVAEERDRQEAAWLAAPPDPASAFARGDELLASWTARLLEQRPDDRRPWWVRHYWRRRARRAGFPSGPTQ